MLLVGQCTWDSFIEWQWVSHPFFHLSSCSHAATRLKLWSTCFEMLPLTSLKTIEEICDRKKRSGFDFMSKIVTCLCLMLSSRLRCLRCLHVFAIFISLLSSRWKRRSGFDIMSRVVTCLCLRLSSRCSNLPPTSKHFKIFPLTILWNMW